MTCSLETVLNEMNSLPAFVGIDLSGPNTKGNFGDYPLHVAVVMGNLEYVKVLINSGAHVNEKGEHGYTPLHEAIEQEHCGIVQTLLDNGADMTLKNDDGISSEDLAKTLGKMSVVKVISKYC